MDFLRILNHVTKNHGSVSPDSRLTSLRLVSRAARADCKCRRKCTYKAMATHTTTSVLIPRIRNHQIIRTTDEDNRWRGAVLVAPDAFVRWGVCDCTALPARADEGV